MFPYINILTTARLTQCKSSATNYRAQSPTQVSTADSITSMTLRTRLIDQSHDGFFHTCLTFVILSKIANTWISNTRWYASLEVHFEYNNHHHLKNQTPFQAMIYTKRKKTGTTGTSTRLPIFFKPTHKYMICYAPV